VRIQCFAKRHWQVLLSCECLEERTVTHDDVEKFRLRWGIRPVKAEEFQKFKHRIADGLRDSIGGIVNYYNPSFWQRLAQVLGYRCESTSYRYFESSPAYQIVLAAQNLSQVAEALQAIFWSLREAAKSFLAPAVSAVKTAIDLTPDIEIRLVTGQDGVLLYPAGAELLDKHLVEEPLIWLAPYPEVAKHFEAALQIYSAKDPSLYRNLLDNLRFAVEQMVKAVLKNEKSLENQKGEMLAWLKAKGLHDHIVAMYHELLFGRFTNYQNEAVKHAEEHSPDEIEFMIYLSGLFLRLMVVFSQKS